MQYSVQTQPVQQLQHQPQPQQQQQSFFQPAQQQQPLTHASQTANMVGQFQPPTQQASATPSFTVPNLAPTVQAPVSQLQPVQAHQVQPCQITMPQQQQQLAPQPQLQLAQQQVASQPQAHFTQPVNSVPATSPVANPVVGAQPAAQNQQSVVQPIQLPPPQQQQQQQHHHAFINQQQARVQPRSGAQLNVQAVHPQPQQPQQPINGANNSTSANNQSSQSFHPSGPTGQQQQQQQLIAAVTPTTRAQAIGTPINSVQSDSLTEADQQAAMAALYAATEEVDSANNNSDNYATANGTSDVDGTYTIPGEINEDHPPPGYDEAIGLVLSRGQANGNNNYSHTNMTAAANYLQANTMVKPAVPVPSTTCTPPPALPPRRLINGMGLEEVDDSQPSACLSLAERYGLPVAEI